jgi:hypothetical protein
VDLLKSFRDLLKEVSGDDQKAQEAKQILGVLAKLAEAKADIFEQQLKTTLRTAGTDENLSIPVEAVLDSYVETSAYMNNSPDVVQNTITTAIEKLAPGTKQDIVGGISQTLAKAIGGFLGSSSASDTTVKEVKVLAEGLSVIRLDILCWQYTVSAIGMLSQQIQSVSVLVMAKSAVDMNELGLNSFLNLYRTQLEKEVSNETLGDAIDEVRRIYRHFQDDSEDDD